VAQADSLRATQKGAKKPPRAANLDILPGRCQSMRRCSGWEASVFAGNLAIPIPRIKAHK